jgi:hypothetical protein
LLHEPEAVQVEEQCPELSQAALQHCPPLVHTPARPSQVGPESCGGPPSQQTWPQLSMQVVVLQLVTVQHVLPEVHTADPEQVQGLTCPQLFIIDTLHCEPHGLVGVQHVLAEVQTSTPPH